MAENACGSCHDPHGGSSRYWLLKYPAEEDNCLVCHDGAAARVDIRGEMIKPSRHPVGDYAEIHSPRENPLTMERHIECTDCHNPHQAEGSHGTPPRAPGSLRGVSGVDVNGTPIENILCEYELCFKCHETASPTLRLKVPRYDPQVGIRREFLPSNPSFHPLVMKGRNPQVPSLIAPNDINSVIYCTDCHAGESSGEPGGVRGPHGSIHEPILRDRMTFTDHIDESPLVYALCYRCHDRNSILADQGFQEHRKHVVELKVSCTTCHDSHGSATNTHLINFSTEYVSAHSSGRLAWIDGGTYRGTCVLKCHGIDHDKSYGR